MKIISSAQWGFLCVSVVWFFMISCKEDTIVTHIGENHSNHNSLLNIDTMCINFSELTGSGNFYLKDTVITFVDAVNYKFYDINLDGQGLDIYFGKGHGKQHLVQDLCQKYGNRGIRTTDISR